MRVRFPPVLQVHETPSKSKDGKRQFRPRNRKTEAPSNPRTVVPDSGDGCTKLKSIKSAGLGDGGLDGVMLPVVEKPRSYPITRNRSCEKHHDGYTFFHVISSRASDGAPGLRIDWHSRIKPDYSCFVNEKGGPETRPDASRQISRLRRQEEKEP